MNIEYLYRLDVFAGPVLTGHIRPGVGFALPSFH